MRTQRTCRWSTPQAASCRPARQMTVIYQRPQSRAIITLEVRLMCGNAQTQPNAISSAPAAMTASTDYRKHPNTIRVLAAKPASRHSGRKLARSPLVLHPAGDAPASGMSRLAGCAMTMSAAGMVGEAVATAAPSRRTMLAKASGSAATHSCTAGLHKDGSRTAGMRQLTLENSFATF